MSKNYNNHIIIHDFTQKLNFYAKNNFFSGYLNEQNKSTNLRYQKEKLKLKLNNNSLKKSFDKNFANIKQRQSNSLVRSTPKYLFPSMENNLLCENLFQRKSQILPDIQRSSKLFSTKFKKNNNILERTNERKNSKKKTVFLSTTSFEIKKRENSKQKNLFNTSKKQIINIMDNIKSKSIKPYNNINILNNPLNKVNSETAKIKPDPFYYYIISNFCNILIFTFY